MIICPVLVNEIDTTLKYIESQAWPSNVPFDAKSQKKIRLLLEVLVEESVAIGRIDSQAIIEEKNESSISE